MDEKAIIAKIFAACLATVSNHDDLQRCVMAGAQENKIEWHCSMLPDQDGDGFGRLTFNLGRQACTPAVWEFNQLYDQALFDAAKKAMGKHGQ